MVKEEKVKLKKLKPGRPV